MDLQGVIDFEKRGGLVTAIAQDHRTGEVLMVAYMNEQALRRTLETGHAVYWSTSRERLWPKGEESGNVQIVKAVRADCDGDAVLLSVEQVGEAACHTGRRSCFYRRREGDGWVTESEPLFDPAEVYRK